MSELNDHLYLLEVLVDNVTVATNDDPDIAVQVKFGDVGTFLIRRTSVGSADPTDVDIADGKCLLFSMRPSQLQNYMELHPLFLSVVKMTTGETICVAKFTWDESFISMVSEPCPVEPNAQFDTLDLMDADDDERFVGFVDVLVRLSCHGKNIMSQFQRRLEAKGKDNTHGNQIGVYHSDIAPLVPVISTVEVSEGLVIGMLPTDNPVTCVHERIKNPSELVAKHFSPQDILYEINGPKKSNNKPSGIEDVKPLRPCIKPLNTMNSKIRKFLASDPHGFHPYVKQQAMISLNDVTKKGQISDPLDRVEELTTGAVISLPGRQPESNNVHDRNGDITFIANDNILEDLCRNRGQYSQPDHRDEKHVYMTTTMPAQHFVCQGGGCKNITKKRTQECNRAKSCKEGVRCIPVPPCMQFNPCEYPTCLGGQPAGFHPCYLPPCPADRMCKPCKQSPWMSTPPKKIKKKRRVPTNIVDMDTEAEKLDESDDVKPTVSDDTGDPSTSVTKKKGKSKKQRRKCGGSCLSRGLDRYYNPRFRQGHRSCVPELISPQGVPPNMGWLWNVPNPGVSQRPGWRPGAVHKKVFEIMCKFKNTNYEDVDDLRVKFEQKKQKDVKPREKRLKPIVNVARVQEPYVELRKDKFSFGKLAGGGSPQIENKEDTVTSNNKDELKKREVLLQKTLTEVCRELCLSAYSDLFLNGMNIDLDNSSSNNHRKLVLNLENVTNILSYAEQPSIVMEEPSEEEIYQMVDLNKPISNELCIGNSCTSNTNNLAEDQSQKDQHQKGIGKRIMECLKEIREQNSLPKVETCVQQVKCSEENEGKDAPEQSICNDISQSTCNNNNNNNKVLDSSGESAAVSTVSNSTTPQSCKSDLKVDDSTKSHDKTSGTECSTRMSLSAGQDSSTKRHKCRHRHGKHEPEARLYGEIDRILRIKEEAEACKLLMRKYIQDMENAHIARENKYGGSEKSQTSTESNSEQTTNLSSVLTINDYQLPIMDNASSATVSEVKPISGQANQLKSYVLSGKVPVDAKVSSWLNNQTNRKTTTIVENETITNVDSNNSRKGICENLGQTSSRNQTLPFGYRDANFKQKIKK